MSNQFLAKKPPSNRHGHFVSIQGWWLCNPNFGKIHCKVTAPQIPSTSDFLVNGNTFSLASKNVSWSAAVCAFSASNFDLIPSKFALCNLSCFNWLLIFFWFCINLSCLGTIKQTGCVFNFNKTKHNTRALQIGSSCISSNTVSKTAASDDMPFCDCCCCKKFTCNEMKYKYPRRAGAIGSIRFLSSSIPRRLSELAFSFGQTHTFPLLHTPTETIEISRFFPAAVDSESFQKSNLKWKMVCALLPLPAMKCSMFQNDSVLLSIARLDIPSVQQVLHFEFEFMPGLVSRYVGHK